MCGVGNAAAIAAAQCGAQGDGVGFVRGEKLPQNFASQRGVAAGKFGQRVRVERRLFERSDGDFGSSNGPTLLASVLL